MNFNAFSVFRLYNNYEIQPLDTVTWCGGQKAWDKMQANPDGNFCWRFEFCFKEGFSSKDMPKNFPSSWACGPTATSLIKDLRVGAILDIAPKADLLKYDYRENYWMFGRNGVLFKGETPEEAFYRMKNLIIDI